jgi:hypothetical protein
MAFSIWCDHANQLTSNDTVFLGDSFLGVATDLRIHDNLINATVPLNNPSGWDKIQIGSHLFTLDSIRTFVPRWGN